MEPRIDDRSETILVGLLSRGGDIGKLWDEFMQMDESVKHRVEGFWYEYHAHQPEGTPGEPFYMAAVEVSRIEDLPEMLFAKVLPAGRYAVFTHNFTDGGYDVLNKRIKDWLDAGPYRMTGNASLQVYDGRFKGIGVPDSILELMVRIEPKA